MLTWFHSPCAARVLPHPQAAISALDTIKPADIKLVQSFKNPPGAIKLVMEAVCILLDIKPQRWGRASWAGLQAAARAACPDPAYR